MSLKFTVRSVRHDFADTIRWHLKRFRREEPLTGARTLDLYIPDEDKGLDPPQYSLFGNGLFLGKGTAGSLVAAALHQVYTAMPKGVRDFVFLHAGAVTANQEAILLPAAMDTGKSSLTLALLREGFDYLSDEFGAIDPVTARLHPVPRLLHIDDAATRFFPGLEGTLEDRTVPPFKLTGRFLDPEHIGRSVGHPSGVGWIVFPTPRFDGPARLIPISRVEAMESLARASFNLAHYRERAVILLSRVVHGAQLFRLEGGSPSARAALISETVRG